MEPMRKVMDENGHEVWVFDEDFVLESGDTLVIIEGEPWTYEVNRAADEDTTITHTEQDDTAVPAE